ncbi:MAG: hypothetical protein HY352_04055 [Candidatus Omnitrophica bacterium]|nr:hypothetical protein [Candidatus Omnitrophota bacterium]
MGNRRGQSVVLAYLAVVIFSVLGSSLLNHSLSTQRQSEIQRLHTEATYYAEGGLEDAISQFAQDIANFVIDPNIPTYPADGTMTTTFSSGAAASSLITQAELVPRAVVDPDGTTVFVKNYHVTTTATHHSNSTVQVRLHQIVERRMVYTFQHAVFYDNDLEWIPGPNMTLSGRVHSNNDIYLAAESTLTVDSEYLQSAGAIYNKRKDSSAMPPGNVSIKKLGLAQYANMAGLDSSSPTWPTDSQTRWLGTVKSDVHGVTKRAVPVVGSTAPGGFYDTNATVKIVNGTITDKNGNPLTVPAGTVTTSTTFYNNREGKYVKMTDIDLKKLAGYAAGDPPGSPSFPNHLPSNGLIYATRTDASGSQEPGIRLRNAAEIYRSGGLTVVSNTPMYVQGNYNTVNKKPVAVIADALNLLSNAWNDANSTVNNVNSGSPRTASSTTYNAAFIAGVDTTTPGKYNGGLENYPRLHERWTNQTLSIMGSFVSLWTPQVANGQWKYGQQGSNSQYTAPVRSWNYDTSFSTGVNMPPFTPYAVEMQKGAWWKE